MIMRITPEYPEAGRYFSGKFPILASIIFHQMRSISDQTAKWFPVQEKQLRLSYYKDKKTRKLRPA